MDKITFDNYKILPSKDKLQYIIDALELENKLVYGKVEKVEKKEEHRLSIIPYDANGKQGDIFLDYSKFEILGLNVPDSIDENDYVEGILDSDEREPYIRIIRKMDSFEEFRKKLLYRLNEKWQKEGFVLSDSDIARYDGEIAFDEWVSDKVKAMIEEKYKTFLFEKYKTFLHNKMKQQEQEFSSLKEKKDGLIGNVELWENIKKEKNKELESLQTELKSLQERKQKEQRELNSLQKEKEEIEYYKKLGIISNNIELLENKTKYCNGFKQLVEDVWEYLCQKKNLYYEKFTVRYFMNALRTQQLTILWGRPGTGKTSLPRAVAEAIQAECVCVQVQSNWTDNQDLLGFYNIVDKRYVSTQFLDALVDASNHPEQMYIILLDEMNLSNVEYYFSEMLNVFTWDKPYTLHLYSKRLMENANKDLKEAKTQEEQEKEVSKLAAILENMCIYPPEFTIPKNVRFVGTLNTDATTKTISPKVIDRSCLIELQTILDVSDEKKEESLPKELALDGDKVVVKADKFEIKKSSDANKEFKQIIQQIRKTLSKADISVSNRIDLYIDQWTGWNDDSCVELDEIVLEKILPLIDIEDSQENRNVIKELKEEILEVHNCTNSLIKIEKMEKQINHNNRILYWEN